MDEEKEEKEFYKEKIVEMLNKIENVKILKCIFTFVLDIAVE